MNKKSRGILFLSFLFFAFQAPSSQAGPARDKANTLFNRIAGIPPSAAQLDQMEGLISEGKWRDAAYVAIAAPSFYNLTLKIFAAPKANVAKAIDITLNDNIALVIGMVRDNVPFNEVLTTDRYYIGAPGLMGVTAWARRVDNNGNSRYDRNDHYASLERNRIDLSNPVNMISVSQSAPEYIGVPSAGVITTRGFAEAYYSAGTNRRPFAVGLMDAFLCTPPEMYKDTIVPDNYVRRDVDRAPGGESAEYLNKCKGCHALQDPMTKAFAYLDFDNDALAYSAGQVRQKLNRNSNVFPTGATVTDDQWVNLFTTGKNASIGWRVPEGYSSFLNGTGHKSLGATLAATKAFSRCTVKKIFQQVCLRAPSSEDQAFIDQVVEAFEAPQGSPAIKYNLKHVYAEVSKCVQ
jgi:hypothetical protein